MLSIILIIMCLWLPLWLFALGRFQVNKLTVKLIPFEAVVSPHLLSEFMEFIKVAPAKLSGSTSRAGESSRFRDAVVGMRTQTGSTKHRVAVHSTNSVHQELRIIFRQNA